jgi:hypothetical protein
MMELPPTTFSFHFRALEPDHPSEAEEDILRQGILILAVADYADLDDITQFVAEYDFSMKDRLGLIPIRYLSSGTALECLKERYKPPLKAIIDCYTQNIKTGLVLKIQHAETGAIYGVMALNIVSRQRDDPWSRTEAQEIARQTQLGTNWTFPVGYKKCLDDIIARKNNGRPIISEFLIYLKYRGSLPSNTIT